MKRNGTESRGDDGPFALPATDLILSVTVLTCWGRMRMLFVESTNVYCVRLKSGDTFKLPRPTIKNYV
jgi:hypothetical protein